MKFAQIQLFADEPAEPVVAWNRGGEHHIVVFRTEKFSSVQRGIPKSHVTERATNFPRAHFQTSVEIAAMAQDSCFARISFGGIRDYGARACKTGMNRYDASTAVLEPRIVPACAQGEDTRPESESV